MSAAEHARRFAVALLGEHGGLLEGLQVTLQITRSHLSGPSMQEPGGWFSARPDVLGAQIVTAAQTEGVTGVYLGVGLTRGRRAVNPAAEGPDKRYKRLAVPDVDGLAWLWVDIDLAGEAHGDKKPLCPDEAAALSIIADTGLPPTLIIRTGHGLQAWWRLSTPLIFGWIDGEITDDGVPVIDPERVAADRQAAMRLVKDWIKTLQIRGQRLGGWHVDPTSDLARMLRCPGSTNFKIAGDARRVEIIGGDPSRIYDLDDITGALAPEELLAAHRHSSGDGSTALKGVDLAALWREVSAAPDHTPELIRLAMQAEGEWGGTRLTALWTGAADGDYGHNDSTIDIALAACLLGYDFTAADCAQAIMGRRLRTGRKPEKADPRPGGRGDYYLGLTIGRAVASHRERTRARTDVARAITADAAAAEGDPKPAPVRVGVLTLERPEPESIPPAPAEPEEPKPAPAMEPPGPPERVSLRAAPDPVPDAAVEYADAPRTPRQGIDDPTPAGPGEDERYRADLLAKMLGLPDGVTVWAVGIRRLAERDEIKLWCKRGEGAEVFGLRWPVGTIRATRWLPKKAWATSSGKAQYPVQEMLFEELHIACSPASDWKSEGRKLLFSLARDMPQGTPAAVAKLAILELLGGTPGLSSFGACCQSGEPWITEDEVWVRVKAVQDQIKARSGIGLGGLSLVDVLAELGCRVLGPLVVTEDHRTIHDPRQWARIPEYLATPEVWAGIRANAETNDAERLSAGRELRRVGGE